jgi:paraquat-inducible protein A
MRAIQMLHPWGMVEVFLLGVLVSLVKLAHLAQVHPGIGLWSFFVLIVLLATSASRFDAALLWERYEACRAIR